MKKKFLVLLCLATMVICSSSLVYAADVTADFEELGYTQDQALSSDVNLDGIKLRTSTGKGAAYGIDYGAGGSDAIYPDFSGGAAETVYITLYDGSAFDMKSIYLADTDLFGSTSYNIYGDLEGTEKYSKLGVNVTSPLTVTFSNWINIDEIRIEAANLSGNGEKDVAASIDNFTYGAASSLPEVTLNVNNTSISEDGVATVTGTLSAVASSDAVTLTAAQDTRDENDETIIVAITDVTNGTESGTQQVTVTLTDDDDAPSVSVNNPSIAEGDSGSASLEFIVSLSEASGKSITVDYATAAGTATAGTDYTAISTTSLTFAAGETSKTIPVTVLGDTVIEVDETVLLNLTNPLNATISEAQGTGTMTNDDTSTSQKKSNTSTDSEADNSESQATGITETLTNTDGQVEKKALMDNDKLENILKNNDAGATAIIEVKGNVDIATGTLNGQMVKNMEDKEGTLVLQTESVTYTLPTSEININAISNEFGTNVLLSDIDVSISISKSSDTMTKIVEDVAQDGGFAIVVPSMDYTITCSYGAKEINVNRFNGFVERKVAIPEDVDPSKITTGIVVAPDGTIRHVPTRIIQSDGKYYAIINSLTNSTYSVIWHPVEFSDVADHWAKDAINNMGSRMIVTGIGDNNYDPNRSVTRAEFATIIVRALGLESESSESGFHDVSVKDWYYDYVKTATTYDIISGYGDGIFGPNDLINREQAMTMMVKAMKITNLNISLTTDEANLLLSSFSDGLSASDYAKDSIAICLKAGIISGTSETKISPKVGITRAEVAVMIQALLEKSELI